MDIGLMIREKRKASGLTQARLAELSGVAVITIQQYERGKRQPRLEQLRKIANALGVPVAQLMGWDEDYEFRDAPETGHSGQLEAIKKWAAAKGKDKLNQAYESLNEQGQQKAVERVEELTEIPKYKKE